MKCNETINKYCVKCTLNMKREEKQFNIYTNINQNILFRLSFKAIVLLQCILQFLSFLDYTKLKMTCKILYNRLIDSKTRYGLYSIDITHYGMSTLTIIKALKYWKNCIKHITIQLFWKTKSINQLWKNFPKLKKINFHNNTRPKNKKIIIPI